MDTRAKCGHAWGHADTPKARPSWRRTGSTGGMEEASAVLGAARGAGTLAGVQVHLTDANGLRGHLDALVVAAELERLLQRQLPRRHDRLGHVGRRGPHVGELLLL